MKGIFKKLFLGLFLCALICAGFSKNVKAAAEVKTIDVDYAVTTGIKITVEMDGSADDGESHELMMGYDSSTTTAATPIGSVERSGSAWTFTGSSSTAGYMFSATISGNKIELNPVNTTEIDAQKEMIRSVAKSKLGGTDTSGTIYVNVSCESKTENEDVKVFIPKVTVTVSGASDIYKEKPELRVKDSDFEVDIYSYPGGTDNKWCITGESFGYELKGNDLGKKYLNSLHKTIDTPGATDGGTTKWRETIGASYSGTSIVYKYVGVKTVGFTPYTIEDANIIVNGTSKPRKVALTGVEKIGSSDLWESYSAGDVKLSRGTDTSYTINNAELSPSTEFTLTPTKSGNRKLFVDIYDKAIDSDNALYSMSYNFNAVAKPSNLKFDPTSYTVAEGYTKQTHVYLGTTEVTDDCTFSSSKDTVADVDGYGEITGIAKSSSPVTITAEYDWSSLYEGTTGTEDPLKATASVKVGSGSAGGKLKFNTDPVCVSEGCEVNLVDFMTTDDKTMDVDLYLEGGIAKLGSKITTPEELKKVKIKGTKAGKKTDGITVWPFGDEGSAVMADLKVYPSPSISTGSSGGFGSFNSSSSSSNAGITVSVPASTYHGGESEWVPSVKYAFVTFNSLSSGKSTTLRGSVSGTTSSDTKTATVSLATVSNEISKIAKGDNDQIYVVVNPESAESDMLPDKAVSGVGILNAFKIELKGDSATYKVNGESVKDYFYAIADQEYTIESVAKNSGDKFQKWEGDESSTAKIDKIKFSSPRTLHAVYGNSSSSSSSSSSSKLTANGTGTGADSEGLDDVPKTGESKTDIWILWTVLLVSILGAGFMIYRRFGVVNAIAQAQADETAAIEQEKIDAEVKEKEDKLRVLKNLRNLK